MEEEEEERGKSSEVKFFERPKWTWHRLLCVGWFLSLTLGKDDFPFEEAVGGRRGKGKQVELEGKVLWWDLKATFEGNEGKVRAGRERGKSLGLWNYKRITELDLELVKKHWLQMVLIFRSSVKPEHSISHEI